MWIVNTTVATGKPGRPPTYVNAFTRKKDADKFAATVGIKLRPRKVTKVVITYE